MSASTELAASLHSLQLATMSVSVAVPVYNAERTLPLLAERLQAALGPRLAAFELILVNDGSLDGSWEAIERLAREHRWVQGFSLMRNYGQHNALLCGIRAARYEVIVTIDDDLQHPPEEIPRLLEKLGEGYDVVYGRPQRQTHGLFRDTASAITKLVLRATMGAQTAAQVSAFRAFRAGLREAFARYDSPHVCIDVLLTWGTKRFAGVGVRHDPRRIGASHYTGAMLATHALNMMTGFSTLPLRLASLVGFVFTLWGLAVLAFVLIRYLIARSSVAGFPFMASIIAIFSGAQLFALGIIGEYLARIHSRLLDRPSYTVRSTTG